MSVNMYSAGMNVMRAHFCSRLVYSLQESEHSVALLLLNAIDDPSCQRESRYLNSS